MQCADREAYLAYQRAYGKRRCKLKERERNAARRKDPAYAAAQVERKRKWREANRDRHLETSRAYDAKQRRENIQRRISKNLRHRLRKAMIGETRGASAVHLLGCSIQEFRDHLERKFQPGMGWNNYGLGGWHIDHIHPLAGFDLTDPAQISIAFHFSNCQPLWQIDNQRKWCKPHRHTWDSLYSTAVEAVGQTR